MGKVLIFGAGNIGRGFLGIVFYQAGYSITFADVDPKKTELINKYKSYPVFICSGFGIREEEVKKVKAIYTQDKEQIIKAICDADLILSAVGKVALEKIAPILAEGLSARTKRRPKAKVYVVVIACENVLDNTLYLKNFIFGALPEDKRANLNSMSFPNCIVDRIVPNVLPKVALSHPLSVAVEDYFQFVIDGTQLKEAFPRIPGIEISENVSAKLEQKLFTLNMAHGILGYFGLLKGLEFVHEASEDKEIRQLAFGALAEVEEIIVSRHPSIIRKEQRKYAERAMERFGNTYLRDSLSRVASSPKRKLGREERFILPARLLWDQGIIPANLATGIASAYRSKYDIDPEAREISIEIESNGIDSALDHFSGLKPENELARLIKSDYLLVGVSK